MSDEQGGGLPSLDLETLLRLCALINQRSGLSYNESSRSVLERRLGTRLEALGLQKYSSYLEVLATRPEELKLVFEALTTKETYFYRQEYQLQTFVDEVVPLLAEGRPAGARLTVWSAGCSSGEETYTLAMLLSGHPRLRGWKVRVIGTDLCASNIETAERGVYRATSFRSTSEENLGRYFTKVGEGYQVNADLRRMVHFNAGNLVEPADVRSVGRVDVIFCRNVLIYFDQKTRQTTTDLFYERLLPGGFLLLGHSESLLNTQTRFEPVHLEGDLVYRRPLLERSSGSRNKNAS
jgi:chemotaxis protein methyltransferase CheR